MPQYIDVTPDPLNVYRWCRRYFFYELRCVTGRKRKLMMLRWFTLALRYRALWQLRSGL